MAAAVRVSIRAREIAANVTPSELCSAQALQRRAEAGPRRLQRGVRQRSEDTMNANEVVQCQLDLMPIIDPTNSRA